MAIVKATYTKSRSGAKASIRYIQYRPGQEQTRLSRVLFGADGQMERQEAYRMIDEAGEGSVFFRFVLSPDPTQEDTQKDLHLREVTEQTMQTLEERIQTPVAWVAVEHNDHAPHRHVHVIAVVSGRVQVQDLQALRQVATEASVAQRRQLDQAREQHQREQARTDQEEAQWERGR